MTRFLLLGALLANFADARPLYAFEDKRLNTFYDLLFAQGCKKHSDFIPGRNKYWLKQAGFKETEFPMYIAELKRKGSLIEDDGFIVGKVRKCA